ncbi:MAG: hypothetical protein N2999_04070 [Proteobacteria bacterium]|nr:hypothetical protein [Pseudomonadota bacterium]
MKSFVQPFKERFSQKLSVSFGNKNFDKVLMFQIFLLIFLVFFKVYVRCLYINEEKRINVLKYDIKITQGEIGKLKTDLDKYVERERLDQLAKAFKKEDEIEVYVVR